MALGQVQQIAACNALHDLQQRLARWLLQAHDLLNSDGVPLTREYLSQMLGANRSSVTLAARNLQQTGLIYYHRGHIRLLDRGTLEDVLVNAMKRSIPYSSALSAGRQIIIDAVMVKTTVTG